MVAADVKGATAIPQINRLVFSMIYPRVTVTSATITVNEQDNHIRPAPEIFEPTSVQETLAILLDGI
jgi:hypothetical protein